MIVFDAIELNKYLLKFDLSTLENYFHELVDSWISRGKLNYQKYSSYIDLEDWWNLDIQLRKAAGQFIESESSEEFATQLQKIDDRIRSSLIKLFNDRKTDVTEILVCESNNISRTNLKDFDWSVKLASCSDKQCKLNELLCHVVFQINDSEDKKEASKINFEMRKNDLDKFITDLETIQKHVESYE